MYSIGPRALAIGLSYVEQMRVWQVALPYLMELSLECADRPWTIVLAMFDGRDILLLERLWTRFSAPARHGDRDRRQFAPHRSRLGPTSPNSAMRRPRTSSGRNAEEIRPKVEFARASQGMAFASGELQPGVDALSAPILDSSGRVTALLIVGGTEFREELHLESRTATRVLRIVTRVSSTLSARSAIRQRVPPVRNSTRYPADTTRRICPTAGIGFRLQ